MYTHSHSNNTLCSNNVLAIELSIKAIEQQ